MVLRSRRSSSETVKADRGVEWRRSVFRRCFRQTNYIRAAGIEHGVQPHGTLAIEEQFYLLAADLSDAEQRQGTEGQGSARRHISRVGVPRGARLLSSRPIQGYISTHFEGRERSPSDRGLLAVALRLGGAGHILASVCRHALMRRSWWVWFAVSAAAHAAWATAYREHGRIPRQIGPGAVLSRSRGLWGSPRLSRASNGRGVRLVPRMDLVTRLPYQQIVIEPSTANALRQVTRPFSLAGSHATVGRGGETLPLVVERPLLGLKRVFCAAIAARAGLGARSCRGCLIDGRETVQRLHDRRRRMENPGSAGAACSP